MLRDSDKESTIDAVLASRGLPDVLDFFELEAVLNKAKKELEFKDHFDTIIINEDFSEACLQARKIVLEFLNK